MTVSPLADRSARTDLTRLDGPADDRLRSAAVAGVRTARRDGVLDPTTAHALERGVQAPGVDRGSLAAGVLAGALTDWLAQDRAADQVREAVGVLTEALRGSDAGSAERAMGVLTDPAPLPNAHDDEVHPGLTHLVFALSDLLEEGFPPARAQVERLAERARRRAGRVGEAVLAVTWLYLQRCGEPVARTEALDEWLAEQPVARTLLRRHAEDPTTETIAEDLLAAAGACGVGLRDVVTAGGWLLVELTDPVSYRAAA